MCSHAGSIQTVSEQRAGQEVQEDKTHKEIKRPVPSATQRRTELYLNSSQKTLQSGLPYLAQVQGDIQLVVLGAAGQGGALPPSLSPVDGVGDGVGAVTVVLTANVTVLPLRRQRGGEDKPVNQEQLRGHVHTAALNAPF